MLRIPFSCGPVDDIIDNSDLYVGQIQHGYSLGERQRFTYGVDLLLTRPDTEGINQWA